MKNRAPHALDSQKMASLLSQLYESSLPMKILFAFAITFLVGCGTTGSSSNPFQVKALIKPQTEIDKHPFGSENNPVRVYYPEGERAYIENLRCTDGSRVSYQRVGSVGIGPYGNILDLYSLSCFVNETLIEYKIYMDMYHPDYKEMRPIPGLINSDDDLTDSNTVLSLPRD